MKTSDEIRFAIHNILNNKVRSITTCFIVFLLSFILMAILSIGFSINYNLDLINEQRCKEIDPSIYMEGSYNMLKSNEKYIDDLLENNSELVKSFSYISYDLMWIDYRFFNNQFTITNGQTPNENMSGLNYIYIYEGYQKNYSLDDTYTFKNKNFIIKGFIKEDYGVIIMDYKFYINNFDSLDKANLELSYSDISFNKYISKLEKLNENFSYIAKKTECNVLKIISQIQLYKTIIISLVTVLTILVGIMTIGNISNTIMISIDKNYHFLQMLKMLGATNKNILSINIFECIITMIVGVFFSFILLLMLSFVISDISRFFVNEIVNIVVMDDFVFHAKIPIYIPIIICLILTVFTLLSSKNTLKMAIKK